MRNPLSDTIVTIQPSGIRKFFDIVSEMKGAISLGVGEPDFDTPWHIREEGIRSLEKGRERTGEIIRIYNEMRPHMSNDYLTPQQAHQQNGTLRRRWKTYYKKKEELCGQINEVM